MDEGSLTTQRIDTDVRECVWEIAQPMSVVKKQGPGPVKFDPLIDCCIAQISVPASNRLLW